MTVFSLPMILVALASLGVSSASVANQQAAAGRESAPVAAARADTTTWVGTLAAGSVKLRLVVTIANESGPPSGTLRSVDQNNTTVALASVSIAGDSLSFSIPTLSAHFSGHYSTDRKEAAGIFQQGGSALPLTLTLSASGDAATDPADAGRLQEAWIGKLPAGLMTPIMQFRIVVLPSGDRVAFFDSITEGRRGFAATWSMRGDSLAFDAASIKLSYRGVLNAARDSAVGIWSQGGRAIPLTLAKHSQVYDNTNVWANRPQRPVGPFPYDQEEVRFTNAQDSVTLAGTLTLPRKAGRFPVVVLISGSGPQDRDETLMEHKPFLVLADYLTRRGIAVLRYDDRGTASSTGNFGTATTEDFARDASAAVAFLHRHARINPDQIGLAGHSEGGLIAPMVAGLRDDVAIVVLLAATGVDGTSIILSQTAAIAKVNGASDAELERILKLNRAVIDASLRLGPDADLVKQMEPTIQEVARGLPAANRDAAITQMRLGIRNSESRMRSPWMQYFLRYDPRPALQRLTAPVLAVAGLNDLQVLPALNVHAIRRALTEGGNKDFTIVELPGLNHLFQLSQTGSMDEYLTIQETFNPGAMKVIGDWIVRHTTGGR
ncbi:MAG: alpha/beta fold hydrolase [Gemmatimonadota bacterium]